MAEQELFMAGKRFPMAEQLLFMPEKPFPMAELLFSSLKKNGEDAEYRDGEGLSPHPEDREAVSWPAFFLFEAAR